jgi:2-dehydropantoate 2-reductase
MPGFYKMPQMRICIFGAGAVGGHLAARLAAGDHEVSVVARGAHLEAMRARGVKLLHGDEVIAGRVRTADIGVQDAVFVTLKANALGGFVDAAAPLLGPATAVVFAQNGIPWWYAEDLPALDPGGKLKNSVPRQNVVGGVVYSANEVVEPGVIRNFVPGNNMLVIGDADNRNPPVVRELRRALESAGISSPPPQDIRQAVWAKLVQNLGSASLCLLTETTTSGITEDPELKALSARMKAEAAAIAAAHGVDIGRAPHRPGGGHVSGAVGHKPSMLQDYLKGRPMEIEAQLMTPLAFARAASVATPTLDIVLPLAAHKAMAKGLYRPFA